MAWEDIQCIREQLRCVQHPPVNARRQGMPLKPPTNASTVAPAVIFAIVPRKGWQAPAISTRAPRTISTRKPCVFAAAENVTSTDVGRS